MCYVFEDERSAELYFSNNPELHLKREGMYRLEKVSLIQTEFFAYYKNCAYRVVGVWAVPTCEFIKYISEMMPITAADVNVKGY